MKQAADPDWRQSSQDWEIADRGLHQLCWIYLFWNETEKQVIVISEPYLKFMKAWNGWAWMLHLSFHCLSVMPPGRGM